MMRRFGSFLVLRFAAILGAATLLAAFSPATAVCACPQPGAPLLSVNFDIFSDHPVHRGESSPPRSAENGDARFTVSGTVDSVDYADNVIFLNGAGGKVRIAITPTTAIAVRGEAGGISDLRHGVRLSASGIIHNGLMTALAITIK